MGFKDIRVVYLTKKLWEFSVGNRFQLILYLSMAIIARLVNLMKPLLIAKIINDIQTKGLTESNISSTIMMLAFIVGLDLLFWAFHGPSRFLEKKNAFLARANMKRFLLEGTMGLSPSWHSDHHSGNTIDKIEKASRGMYEFSRRSYTVLEFLITFIGAYIALIYFNIHASYIVLIMITIIAVILTKFDNVLGKQYRELNKIENSISARIYDSISNITTIVILRAERMIVRSINKEILSPFRLFRKNITLDETKWWLVSLSSTVMTFFVLLSYVLVALNKGDTVMLGTLFVLYSYLDRITGIFMNFTWRWGEYLKYKMQIMNADSLTKEFVKRQKIKPKKIKNWQEIAIQNLDFSYHNTGSDLHLIDVNMKIKRGQRIALIGESGSGKTTVLRVIRELYTAKNSKVNLDGIKVKGGFRALSPHITLIPQDPEIFNSTIKDNITLGLPTKMDKVIEFTDIARFTNVANRLPKKFDSMINEKGVNLSGGEKQRLALARGLMACKSKQIILLDEPTSSVDPTNELRIYDNIFKKFGDKTILSSIHRLHLLHKFDMIYYFDKGKIIAKGTLDEIMKNHRFKRIWDDYNKQKSKR